MTWVATGVAVVGAVLNFFGASSQAQAQYIVAKANADAANLTRKADNEFKGAMAGLQNYIRAEDNKKKFEAAGLEWNAINQNMSRMKDSFLNGSLQDKMAASEELGALTAQASFMGIGGSTVDTINDMISRTYGDQAIENETNFGYQMKDLVGQRNLLIENANSASDQGTSFANLDYSINTATKEKVSVLPYLFNAISSNMNNIRVGLGQMQMNKMKASPTFSTSSAQAQANSQYGGVNLKL